MTDPVPPGGAPEEDPTGPAPTGPQGAPGTPAPSGHGHLRASDADRDRVAEQLRDAVAEGRLDMAEFEERLDAVYRARTYGELAPITRDLPTAGTAAGAAPLSFTKSPAPARDIGAPDWSARIGAAPTSSGALAVCGGFARKGRWTIARLFTAFMFWGGGELDLREASFEARETTVRCFAIMGGLQVTVPEGLNVEVTGIGVMGGFGGMNDFYEGGDPDAPRVKITGFALMGGVGVERKATRAERQRMKKELRRSREERILDRLQARADRDALHGHRRRELDARRADHRARRDARREERRDARQDRRGRRWPSDDDF